MIWKDIPDYEGLYQVSDCGQVKSFKNGKEKILKPGLDRGGYEYVVLCKDGVTKNYKVHRLVMYTHSHVDDELTVNHIDENKRNNHLSNLEYCTRAENVRKYHKNNPEWAAEMGKKLSKIGAKAVKEKLGHKYIDTHTGIIYNSAREVSFMMHETGQAKGNRTWSNILQSGKPQDRFVRVYNESK